MTPRKDLVDGKLPISADSNRWIRTKIFWGSQTDSIEVNLYRILYLGKMEEVLSRSN